MRTTLAVRKWWHWTTTSSLQKVSSLHCCINNTCKILSSRFTRDAVAAEERKRVKRRKKEQKRKMVKWQKNMGIEQAHKLLVQIHGKEIAD